jgi:capsular exopolysaccharide synthesis family protein
VATSGFHHQQLVNTYKKGGLDMKKIATILYYRRFFILGISCVVMSATSLLAVITKPMYQSSMQIMVKDNLYPELSGQELQSQNKYNLNQAEISSPQYTDQITLMVSSKLIQRAVNLLRSDYPQISIEDIKGDSNTGKAASLIIQPVQDNSQFNQGASQVFILSFKDPDPAKTKRVLQALQKVYQDYNVEQRKQLVQKGLDFVHHRLPNLKRQTLAAEKRLEIFRNKYNLIDPEVQSKILLESLADIQKQRRNNRSKLEQVESRYKSVRQQLLSSQQEKQLTSSLERNNNYQTIVNEIRKTELSLAQERLRYTENFPVIIKLEEKRKAQMALLEEELKEPSNNKNQEDQENQEVNTKIVNQLKDLENQINTIINNDQRLAKSEKEIHTQLKTYPRLIAEYNRLISNVKIQRKSFEQMVEMQQLLGLRIAQGGFDLQILEEPDLGIYIGNKKWLLIISGVIIGPFLGIILALLWEKFNQVIVISGDFQKLTNVRLIGSVPKLRKPGNFVDKIKQKIKIKFGNKNDQASSAIVKPKPKFTSHETLDMIYQNLQIFKKSLPFKSLTFTSSLPGEGKTTLALGLGNSAAKMNQRVLVIDANLRSPSLHKILGLSNDWGLSLLLLDDINSKFENYIQPIHPSIDILTAGPKPDDKINLLCSGRLRELIESFEAIYDLVIIDTSSVLDSVDARIVASVSNGIVVVGKVGQLTPHELLQTTEILSQLNLIGIIANQVNESEVRISQSQEFQESVNRDPISEI